VILWQSTDDFTNPHDFDFPSAPGSVHYVLVPGVTTSVSARITVTTTANGPMRARRQRLALGRRSHTWVMLDSLLAVGVLTATVFV
jgi:hypothetical protein